MWLLLLLIRGLIFFSFFSISSSALSVNKESIISKNGKDIAIEGSGSIPTNEILSDDEDFYPDLMKPGSHPSPMEFSGDGSLDHNDHENIPGSNKGHTSITSDKHNPGDDEDDGDNEDDEDDDDEDDDEGSGDSPIKVTNGGSDFSFSTKETITDDDHLKPYDKKPDTTINESDESEEKHNIPIDEDESSKNFFPDVIETSTKQHKPNHDIDHEDHDQDPNTLGNDISLLGRKQDTRPVSFFAQPSMLAAVIGGTVVSLLCAILLAMFIIYRTRKKYEASYICEPNLTSPVISHYGKGSSNKFFDPE